MKGIKYIHSYIHGNSPSKASKLELLSHRSPLLLGRCDVNLLLLRDEVVDLLHECGSSTGVPKESLKLGVCEPLSNNVNEDSRSK